MYKFYFKNFFYPKINKIPKAQPKQYDPCQTLKNPNNTTSHPFCAQPSPLVPHLFVTITFINIFYPTLNTTKKTIHQSIILFSPHFFLYTFHDLKHPRSLHIYLMILLPSNLQIQHLKTIHP